MKAGETQFLMCPRCEQLWIREAGMGPYCPKCFNDRYWEKTARTSLDQHPLIELIRGVEV